MEESIPDKQVSNISKPQKKDKYYLLLIPLFLLLVFVGLVIYYYGLKPGRNVVLEENLSQISVAQIASLKNSERILRGDFNSMTGLVEGINGNTLQIVRKEQKINIPLSGTTKIYLQEYPPEQAIYLDDSSIGSSNEPVEMNNDNPISSKDIQIGDQLLIYFEKPNDSNLVVNSIYVFRVKQ